MLTFLVKNYNIKKGGKVLTNHAPFCFFLQLIRYTVQLRGSLRRAGRAQVLVGALAGGATKNVAPAPTRPSAQTRPPWRTTMRWTLARPMPVPSEFLGAVQALEHAEEAIGELRVEAGAVVPARAPARGSRPSAGGRFSGCRSRRCPGPGRVNLTALPTRLANTWRSSVGRPRWWAADRSTRSIGDLRRAGGICSSRTAEAISAKVWPVSAVRRGQAEKHRRLSIKRPRRSDSLRTSSR